MTTRARGRRRALAGLCVTVALVVLVTGCGGSGDPDPRASASPSAAPLIPEESALPSELPSAVLPSTGRADLAKAAEDIAKQEPTQVRPKPIDITPGTTAWAPGTVYRGIFADPDIVRVGKLWFAYATNTSHVNLPTLVSKDLSTWAPLRSSSGGRVDPLPAVGSWVVPGGAGRGLWAPTVAKVGSGWSAAYSAQASNVGGERHNCIGLARGSGPGGPFRPVGRPICSPDAQLGLIDPEIYVTGTGTPYLLWKFSGVVGQRPAGIFIRELNEDGTDFASGSSTHELMRKTEGWEGNTIENPTMIEFRGVTYLFWSGNSWKTPGYATGYAICSGPEGPCVRAKNGSPFLTTANTGLLGPGGAAAFLQGPSLRLIYHAWDPGAVMVRRRMHIAGLWQKDDGTLQLVHPGG